MTKHYDVIHTKSGYRLGGIDLKHPGWFFISNVASHKGSRVAKDTAEGAIPPWAKRMGCTMLARAAGKALEEVRPYAPALPPVPGG